MARSGARRYTAASSAAPRPTSRSAGGAPAGFSTPSTSWRSPGAILDAQPAQAAYDVSRTSVWVCSVMALLGRAFRELRFHVVDERLGERRAAPVSVRDQIEEPGDAEILHLQAREQPGAALVLDRSPGDDREPDAGAHRLLDRLGRSHLAHDPDRGEIGVRL